jgi:hypothetical protein
VTPLACVRRRAIALGAGAFALALSSVALASPVPTDDIRDIRGPIAIPLWWHWALGIALAALAATAIALGVRWWRRRHVELSPIELARQALVRAEVEARAGRSHQWGEIVAATLRGALATRVGPAVLPQTTSELATADWTKPPLSVELDTPRVLDLLEACDIARFARASFDSTVLLASTEAAREVTERLFATPARALTKAPAIAPTVTP